MRDATEAAPQPGASRQDEAQRTGGRYVAVFLGVLAALLGTVAALNLLLGERALGGAEVAQAASAWQQRTRGVTYAPPVTHARPFKSLRLHDRLAEINGVVLGASTAMGIGASMFPAAVRVYNFASAGNTTASVIGESEHVTEHLAGRVEWLFIALDWSVGMIYLEGQPQPVDLSPRAALAREAFPQVPLHRKLLDALSFPKVKNLAIALRQALRAEQPLSALRQLFWQAASDDYPCPEGVPAKDFDVVNRGACVGFRFDGSWTFSGQRRLSEAEVAPLLRAAVAPSSRYAKPLIRARGEPNPAYLEKIAALADEFGRKGGRVVAFLPPLLPGMEQALLAAPETGRHLARSKAVLERWARRNGIVVLDAGRAEAFGCRAEEFIDEHHAVPECLARVLGRFWDDYLAGRVAPGLYPPPQPAH